MIILLCVKGYALSLETQPDFEVIGTPEQAASGDEALHLSLEMQPDILLLDLEIPVMDGVETIRRLRQQLRRDRVKEIDCAHALLFSRLLTMTNASLRR